jgi:hypothetical protein
MSAIHGVVRGNVVVLPEDAALPDGLRVEVRPLVPLAHPDAIEVEGRFKQQLVEMGLLEKVRRPVPIPADVDRRPIEVEGKPLSELIIEERR